MISGTKVPKDYCMNILRFHLYLPFILNCANMNTNQKFSNCESHNYTVYLFIHTCLKF